jgi:hypothetical protein
MQLWHFLCIALLVPAAWVSLVILDVVKYKRQRTRRNARLRDLKAQCDDLYPSLCELYKEIMSQLGDVAVVADWGTLLGLVRESGIIRHDRDIDLWIRTGDFPYVARVLRSHFKDSDRYSITTPGVSERAGTYPHISVHDEVTGAHCDIDTWVVEGKRVFRGYYPSLVRTRLVESIFIPQGHLSFEVDQIFPLRAWVPEDSSDEKADRSGDIGGGVGVLVPNKPLEVIQRYYGDSWETPIVYA